MRFVGIDLGTTNIKAALYDEKCHPLALQSLGVAYRRQGRRVEFDAEDYAGAVTGLLARLMAEAGPGGPVARVVFTGQAESLVVLGGDGRPLCPAISWMDERSADECEELGRRFGAATVYERTGQLAVLPTWPATKVLWLRRHRPGLFEKAKTYMLLKDYLVWRFTGRMLADRSVATFGLWFDIHTGDYWDAMLQAIGISRAQLPPLAEPCTDAGPLLPAAARAAGLPAGTVVNIGTLDHFAGMVGSGNTAPGTVSLSTGTVMALATLVAPGKGAGQPLHYGLEKGSLVALPVCESGGVCLQWFRDACLPGVSFPGIDAELLRRGAGGGELLFLPYIVGTNAPLFSPDACGLFFGLRARHDAYDMARAVMEGVAHLLRTNCEALKAAGVPLRRIVATGGGAKSALWCQIQADITGIPVEVPLQKEVATLGAAILGMVAAGALESRGQAAGLLKTAARYAPAAAPEHIERQHRRFGALYAAMLAVNKLP